MSQIKKENKRTGVFTRRALLMGAGQIGVLGLLGAKLYQVQVVEGERYATLAESNRISARLIAPPRGRILDRTGIVVGGNKLNWRALLTAEQASDVGDTLDTFARIVPLADHERARIERELRRRRRFIPIVVREFLTWEEMARIEVNAPDLPGIFVDVGTTRLYPQGPALAHVVGYVAPPSEGDMGEDPMLALPGIRIGRNGMEKAQDMKLRGRAGAVQMEVNSVGRMIRELERQQGTPGLDLGLTIDVGLQNSVLKRLGDQSASAVVMDCRNGEVLAMTTNPSFDPSLFNSGVSQAQWVAWTNNRKAPLINKAASGLYAPGSTFKMVTGMAGLESKAIGIYDRISCPGHMDIGDTRFHCWLKSGHGALDLRTALKQSCDVFFYEVARRAGIDRVAAMANRFGIGVDLEVELPGVRKGLMPHPGVAHGPGQGVEHRRHHPLRHRPGLHPDDAARPLHLCLPRRNRACRAAASDPHPGRRAAARQPRRRLAVPGPAGARHARPAGGHVRRRERGRRHRAHRPHQCRRRAIGRQDRVQPGPPRVAGSPGARIPVRPVAVGVPAPRPVRVLRPL